jgi:hypothetical protein
MGTAVNGNPNPFLDTANWQGVTESGSDFDNPDATKRAKMPTVGAIADVFGEYVETPDWINALTSKNGLVFEGITSDGYRRFNLPVIHKESVEIEKDLTVGGKSFNDKIDKEADRDLVDKKYVESVKNSDFLQVVRDAQNKVAYGVKKEGSFYAETIDSPTIDKIEDALKKESIIEKTKVGVIVWEGQYGNPNNSSPTADIPSVDSNDYSNYILFNDTEFRAALREIDGDTYDGYTNWKAYIKDKYNENVQDASLCEVAAYHDDIKDIVEAAIIRISGYSSADITYLQNRHLRKPLDKITLEMLGDDATLDHDVTLGGWGCDGYHTTVYNGTEHIGDEDYGIVESVTFHDTEKVTAQIDLAAKYGIDFFCFYIEFVGWYFDETHSLEYIHKLMQSNLMNNFLFQFLNSPNKYKMKFCVTIGNTLNRYDNDQEHTQNIIDSKKLFRLLEYINTYLVSDPCYLHVDGKPVIQFYEQKPNILDDNFLHIGGCQLLYFPNVKIKKKDGIWHYSGNIPSTSMTISNYQSRDYKVFADYNERSCKLYDRFNIMMYPCAMSRDDRPRWNYMVNPNLGLTVRRSFILPTENELYNQLVDIYNVSRNKTNRENILTIYAWNEFMEGGWLLPTQQDIDNDTWEVKLNAIKRFKSNN